MYQCRIGVRLGKQVHRDLTAYFESLAEAVVWGHEWVRLGCSLVKFEVCEANPCLPPAEYLCEPSQSPEGDTWGDFVEWMAFQEVAKYRQRSRWLLSHQVVDDLDPPYGDSPFTKRGES